MNSVGLRLVAIGFDHHALTVEVAGQFQFIAVPYSVSAESGEILLSDRFTPKAILEPTKANPEITQALSLVSLEFDPFRGRFFILAGYDGGAYLWVLSLNDFNNGGQAQLVRDASGAPYHIAGQPAGLTFIGQDTVLISTNAAGRAPQQATYQIVKLSQ